MTMDRLDQERLELLAGVRAGNLDKAAVTISDLAAILQMPCTLASGKTAKQVPSKAGFNAAVDDIYMLHSRLRRISQVLQKRLGVSVLPTDFAEAGDGDDGLDFPTATKWQYMPVGHIEFVDASKAGVDVPPADAGFVILSTGEDGSGDYNEGKVANETITGSGPTLVATFDIDDETSPLDGQTWHCINDEERVIYAGTEASAGTVWNDQFQGHEHTKGSSYASFTDDANTNGSGGGDTRWRASSPILSYGEDADSNGTPRVGDRTRAKGLQLVAYLKYKDV